MKALRVTPSRHWSSAGSSYHGATQEYLGRWLLHPCSYRAFCLQLAGGSLPTQRRGGQSCLCRPSSLGLPAVHRPSTHALGNVCNLSRPSSALRKVVLAQLVVSPWERDHHAVKLQLEQHGVELVGREPQGPDNLVKRGGLALFDEPHHLRLLGGGLVE